MPARTFCAEKIYVSITLLHKLKLKTLNFEASRFNTLFKFTSPLIIITFEVLTARERNILFQSQKRREEVSSWEKILQCNWSVCFREVFREKSDFFIYNCSLGGSLFTLRLRRAISHDEREFRRYREKEGITREAQRSDEDKRLCCGWCIF